MWILKLHISEWPFIVGSLRHTCALINVSNQHRDMANLWGTMDFINKGEVLTITDLDWFVNNIWEKWWYCVCNKSFRSLRSSHKKWEQKQKCCDYINVECMWRHSKRVKGCRLMCNCDGQTGHTRAVTHSLHTLFFVQVSPLKLFEA